MEKVAHATYLINSLGQRKLNCQWMGADNFEMWITEGDVELARGKCKGSDFDALINQRLTFMSGGITFSRDGHDVAIELGGARAKQRTEYCQVHSESFRGVVARSIAIGTRNGMKGSGAAARPVTLSLTRDEEVAVREFLKKLRR